MQARRSGAIFYGRSRDFVAFERREAAPQPPSRAAVPLPVGTAVPTPPAPAAERERVQSAAEPSESADWKVDVAGGAYEISLPSKDKTLAVDADGTLVLYDGTPPANRGRFTFEPAGGCPTYPEVRPQTGDRSAARPSSGGSANEPTAQWLEFIGGRAHEGGRGTPTRPAALVNAGPRPTVPGRSREALPGNPWASTTRAAGPRSRLPTTSR